MMKKTRINGKWDLILPEHRANRKEWTSKEGWEKKRIESMSQNLTKEDTLLYIGAEEGDISALCAMWVKEIILFEPNPKVWTNIKAIWEANNLPAPLWFSGFAANETTEGPSLIRGFSQISGPIISDHGFSELHDSEGMLKKKIDDLGIVPTAITLDVEGSEFEVLKGAEQVLRKHHPKIWLSLHPEFLLTHWQTSGAELRKWIKDLGYKEILLDYPLHEVHLYYEKN